jgi:hypothetical protein
MSAYEELVNPFPPKTITPRELIEQIVITEAERVDQHVSNQPTDGVDRLLRSLRAAAINGEFLVEIGGTR